MNKIKVSELQPGPQMDALVAEARGWRKNRSVWELPPLFNHCIPVEDCHPSTNGGQAIELVEEYDIWLSSDGDKKIASCAPHTKHYIQEGENHRAAICRAVIASHFGDTVDVDG